MSITLENVCLLIVDCEHKTAPTQNTGYPSIRTPNIGKGRLILEGVNRVSEETYKAWTRRAVPVANDLILAREAPVGNVALIPPGIDVCLGQRTVLIRPDQVKVSPYYLCYLLLSDQMQGKLLSKSTGVTVHHLNVRDIRNLELPELPTLSVQHKIAEIISTYDNLIENNRRRMALLEDSARLLYREWFVYLRFPGHEHVKVVDGVPEGWEDVAVPEIIELNPTEKLPKSKVIWYVPMASLSEAGMTANRSSFELRTDHTNVKFRNGDVLLARITPCLENGKTGFVYFLNEDEVACGSTEFIVMRGKRVSPAFTYCLARSHDFREYAIKSMIGSSGRQRVQASCLNEFWLPLPPSVLLQEFDRCVGYVFSQIRNLALQNEKLSKARDILLPRLMSGEITV
jgi:type I restriction enzyme S subunit